MGQIVLASNSPRRREILESLGVDFKIIGSRVEEKLDKDLPPPDLAKHFAYIKARDVANRLRGSFIVIGADTIVKHNEILGKPKNKEEAYRMLRLLSGKAHQVITGLAIIDSLTGKEYIDYETTRVYFKDLKDEEIEKYIEAGEYIDKAGAYGIQGKASLFIEKIEGDYFNVVGLPVYRLGVALHNNFNISLL